MTYDYDLFVMPVLEVFRLQNGQLWGEGMIAELDLVGGTCVIRGCIPKTHGLWISLSSAV